MNVYLLFIYDEDINEIDSYKVFETLEKAQCAKEEHRELHKGFDESFTYTVVECPVL